MIQKSLLRTAAAAALLGAALSANAFVLTFAGSYTGTFLTANSFTVDGTLNQGLSGFGFQVDPTTTASANGSSSSLSTTLKNFSGTKSLTLTSLAGDSSTFGTTTSFSGIWSGTQVGLGINETGTYSGSFDGKNYAISITGTQPVPEPASMAALGVGALGLLRRRRRA